MLAFAFQGSYTVQLPVGVAAWIGLCVGVGASVGGGEGVSISVGVFVGSEETQEFVRTTKTHESSATRPTIPRITLPLLPMSRRILALPHVSRYDWLTTYYYDILNLTTIPTSPNASSAAVRFFSFRRPSAPCPSQLAFPTPC